MSSIIQKSADAAVVALENSAGTVPVISLPTIYINAGCGGIVASGGAEVAGVLKTALSISGGGGYLDLFAIASTQSGRSMRVKITLDGVVAYDKTSAVLSSSNQGFVPVGRRADFDAVDKCVLCADVSLRFKRSCLVEFASSTSVTNQTNVYYSYRLTE